MIARRISVAYAIGTDGRGRQLVLVQEPATSGEPVFTLKREVADPRDPASVTDLTTENLRALAEVADEYVGKAP